MSQLNRPLVEALQDFKAQQPLSFHVPGHKHGILSTLPRDMRSALAYDVTELTGLDDLHEAEGVIQEAEKLLSTLYRSTRSFFLVNGSTVGNLAMLYATCSYGDTVIVQRNAHKSVFNAIELIGAKPVLVTPPWDDRTLTPGVLTYEQVNEALKEFPHAKAVVLTYPTYYGVAGNELKGIIERCHAQQVPVLIDEAHGAHFIAGGAFPPSAIELGADIVVQSAHKTLPAMTMGSFLHVRSDFIDEKNIAHYLRMLQSSSPSYLVLASLDDARAYIASFTKEDHLEFMALRQTFIDEVKRQTPYEVVETDDPLKLLVRSGGYSGFQLQRAFETVGMYVELADPYQVLIILPLTLQETKFPLQRWLKKMHAAVPLLGKELQVILPTALPAWPTGISTLDKSPSSIKKIGHEWIHIEEASGRVAASSLIPYPPGIPLLLTGEKITASHMNALLELVEMGARVQGADRLSEGKIAVMKIDSEEKR
ncbi:aminotransferase class I/II-fold pyridoxal phosphate-dependent enzyme [Sporosarcina sp. ITBMC105]